MFYLKFILFNKIQRLLFDIVQYSKKCRIFQSDWPFLIKIKDILKRAKVEGSVTHSSDFKITCYAVPLSKKDEDNHRQATFS